MANRIYYQCELCNRESYASPYTNDKVVNCISWNCNGKAKLISRKTRKVSGPFTIGGFENLGYGCSAKIVLEKDGEKFKIYLSAVEKQLIGNTTGKIDVTLFESKSGSWYTSGYDDDYINIDGIRRLKEEVTGTFYVADIKYHKGLHSTRYVRYVLKTLEALDTDNDKEYEVFAKDFGKLSEFFGGKQMTLREEKPSGSYVWRQLK